MALCLGGFMADCTVGLRRKILENLNYDIIGYRIPGCSGFITIIWPAGWPAPAPGSFENKPGGRPVTEENAETWQGILPKEVFGGVGGVTIPSAPPPERPDYNSIEQSKSLQR